MLPPTALPTGVVSYFFLGNGIVGTGTGSGGPGVGFSSFRADLDFGKGTLTNGTFVLTNGGNAWDARFAGAVNGAKFQGTLDTATSLVNVSGMNFPAQGTVTGAVTGPTANGIGGVFDLQQVGAPSTFVKGSFYAR